MTEDVENGDLFDDLVNLETSFYKDGFDEGHKDGLRAATQEGRQFGIQTGFRRYETLGMIQGRNLVWSCMADESGSLSSSRVSKNSEKLDSLLKSVPLTNKDKDVEAYTQTYKKARSQAVTIARLVKDKTPVDFTSKDHAGSTSVDEESLEDIM